MSIDLLEPEEVDDARAALEEFRATQDECDEFFGDVFDELQTLSLELFARHKCLELNNLPKEPGSSADDSLAECRDEFRRAVEQFQHLSSHIGHQLTRLSATATGVAVPNAEPGLDGMHQL